MHFEEFIYFCFQSQFVNYVCLNHLEINMALSQGRTCRPPPVNEKVIVNGAQCSESNGKNNKNILQWMND